MAMTVSHTFLLTTLTIMRSSEAFCRMSHIGIFLVFSSWLGWGQWGGVRIPQRESSLIIIRSYLGHDHQHDWSLDASLAHVAEVVFVRFPFSHAVFLWKQVTGYAQFTLQEWGVRLPAPRAGIHINYVNSCTGHLPILPISFYAIIDLYQCLRMVIYSVLWIIVQ